MGSKDIEKALKALTAAIEGEDNLLVVRIWALCSITMARSGMYDPAKALVEGAIGPVTPRSGNGMQIQSAMDTVNHYYDARKRAEAAEKNMTFMQKMHENQDFAKKVIFGTGVIVTILIIFVFFYWLEQMSLASMSLEK